MAEYTDYISLLTDAATLQDLRGALEQVVPWARVDLPFINETGEVPPEAQWAALPKPVWVIISTPGEVADLAPLGTAFHLMVEQDYQSWGIDLSCGGQAWSYAMATGPILDGSLLAATPPRSDPAGDEERMSAMAACLKVDPAALETVMVPDGGQGFAALLGMQYNLMQDRGLIEKPEPDPIRFRTMYED